MLPKQNRLSQKEFDYIYKHGKTISGDIGFMKILQTEKPTKVSCVVSTNTVNTSVDRTRIRRRAYAAIEEVVNSIPDSYDIIWFLPKKARNQSLGKLRAAFVETLEEFGIEFHKD